MRSISVLKQWLLVLCLLTVVICCCAVPSGSSVPDAGSVRSSASVYRLPRTCTPLPDFINEEALSHSDDACSDGRVSHRKVSAEKIFMLLLLFGLPALLAYLAAEIFHGSACPTYGLLRILTFIFHSDGRKSASLFLLLIY